MKVIEQPLRNVRVKPVPVETIKIRAYRELRRALLEGRFLPGEPLIVRVLSEELGVGLMPVREAIQQLATEGGLEFLPNRTVRVPELSVDEFEEVFAIRLQLEGLAAREAAKRIKPAAIEELRTFFQQMKSALRGPPSEALSSTQNFQLAVYEASNSDLLRTYIERLWLRIGPLLIRPYETSRSGRRLINSNLELYKDLLAALGGKEAKTAEATLREIIKAELDWHRENSFGD